MIVRDVQLLLASFAAFTRSAQGTKAAAALESFHDGLDRFADWDVEDYSQFLAVAHEYHTTGVVPLAAAKAGAKAKASKPAKAPKLDATELAKRAQQLYTEAADRPALKDEVADLSAALDNLTVAQLVDVAASIDLRFGKKPPKKDIVKKIGDRIFQQRGDAIRHGQLAY